MSDSVQTAYLEEEINGEKRRFPLDVDSVHRIGRSATRNAIVVDDVLVSREHALLQRSDTGALCITDLNSSNGTFVNGYRIFRPVVLHPGDRVTIGSHEFSFYEEAAAQPEQISNSEVTGILISQTLITVMVADIRDFVRLTRRVDATKLSQLTGYFFREAGKLLQERGAWAQKYIGDAVMAVWLHKGPEPAVREMAAIFDGVWKLAGVAESLQARFDLSAPIRIGTGVNSGLASVGNVGSTVLSDYTAQGEVVNRTFRLESATKEVGCDLLVGQETLDFLVKTPGVKSLFQCCSVTLKGYDEPATAFSARFAVLEQLLDTLQTKKV